MTILGSHPNLATNIKRKLGEGIYSLRTSDIEVTEWRGRRPG
jgi:hypothetical protein